jgi:hypothetical protein
LAFGPEDGNLLSIKFYRKPKVGRAAVATLLKTPQAGKPIRQVFLGWVISGEHGWVIPGKRPWVAS